jgi:hypothetical protein
MADWLINWLIGVAVTVRPCICELPVRILAYYPLLWLKYFVISFSISRRISEYCIEIGHGRDIPNSYYSLLPIIFPYLSTLYNLAVETTSLNNVWFSHNIWMHCVRRNAVWFGICFFHISSQIEVVYNCGNGKDPRKAYTVQLYFLPNEAVCHKHGPLTPTTEFPISESLDA